MGQFQNWINEYGANDDGTLTPFGLRMWQDAKMALDRDGNAIFVWLTYEYPHTEFGPSQH